MARGDALRRLLDRPVTTVRWGLERIDALLDELGRPERSFESFHIAGTNGKGSTAAFAEAVLRAAGQRTALYTSPHLSDVRERFQLDGAWVGDALLDAAATRVYACAAAEESTYFERATALAFLCFAEGGATHAVVETGLGGRFDATNVLRPAATAITSIGLDHVDLLGGTLAEVAREKAGIIKAGRPVALGGIDGEALAVLEARAAELAAPVARLGREGRVDEIEVDTTGTRFRYRSARRPDGLHLAAGAIGAHQAENAGLALLMLESRLPDLADEALGRGVALARLPGRFELREMGRRRLVLDVAHNEEGMTCLLETARRVLPPRPWVALVAILEDKPWEAMLEALSLDMDAIILGQADSAPPTRRWSPEAARAHLERRFRGPVDVERDIDVALERACGLAGGGTVFVTGSAYTVGDVRSRLDAE